MTTARARAVSFVLGARSFGALLAAAPSLTLLTLSPTALAASCSTGPGNDTCIIDLTSIGDSHDGQAGNDTLSFEGGVAHSVMAANFGTAVGTKFLNFEIANIVSGTTLNITSTAGDLPVSLIWTVDGILNVSGAGGNAIGDSSQMTINGTFNVGESEIIGSLAGSGTIDIAASEILTAGATTSTTFSGVIQGAGGFTKASFGTLTLSGNSSYTGATTIAAGTLLVTNTGALDQSSSVTLSAGAVLKGNATVNNLTSAGVIEPGTSAGTVVVNGTYTVNTTSFLNMEVDVDAATLPGPPVTGVTHDFLDIQGAVAGTGTTYVFLTPLAAPYTGGTTTGNGIQLIRITGANTPAAFVQGNGLTAGAYQYLLRYVANYAGTDDGYFLQSAIRDELVAHPALLSASQELLRRCFRDDQRIPDSPKSATYGRAWLGYRQGNTEFGPDTGIDMDQDFNCTTVGMDWRLGHGWVGGVSGGFGNSTADLVAPSGFGALDGDARVIEVYATFTSSAFFLNLSAGYADLDWIYGGAFVSGEASVMGLIASAQAGVALDVEPFAVKLIGALNYDDTSCGESCFDFPVTEDTGLLEAKATLRFDAVSWGGAIRPWAAVSYSTALSDGVNTVSLGAVAVSADTNDELVSVDAGLQAYLDQNFALFADGGYHESMAKDISGYRGGVGLKLYW